MSQPAPSKPSLKPTRKVAAGGAAAAVVTILVWVLSYFAGVPVPPEVSAAAVTLAAVGFAYMTRDR